MNKEDFPEEVVSDVHPGDVHPYQDDWCDGDEE